MDREVRVKALSIFEAARQAGVLLNEIFMRKAPTFSEDEKRESEREKKESV